MESRGRTGATATLSGNIVRIIVADAVARGLSEREVLDRFDVPVEAVRDVDGRIPARIMVRIWEGMPKLLGDPSYGVHLGARSAEVSTDPPQAGRRGQSPMPLIGRLFSACATVGEGVERLVEMQRLVNDVHASEMIKVGDLVSLRVRTKDSPLPVPRHATEFVFAWMVVTLRRSTGVDVRPLRARFEVTPPEDPAEHRKILGCPVEFDADYNELVFPAATLALPNQSADGELREILDSHARVLLERLPAQKTFAARVADVLAPRLASSLAIDDVAAAMKMSARTLQRYLREEDTTFADVLDAVRKRRAEIALRETDESIAAVSASLGFGDQSAFHKAFVRWTGKTPGAFRKG